MFQLNWMWGVPTHPLTQKCRWAQLCNMTQWQNVIIVDLYAVGPRGWSANSCQRQAWIEWDSRPRWSDVMGVTISAVILSFFYLIVTVCSFLLCMSCFNFLVLPCFANITTSFSVALLACVLWCIVWPLGFVFHYLNIGMCEGFPEWYYRKEYIWLPPLSPVWIDILA